MSFAFFKIMAKSILLFLLVLLFVNGCVSFKREKSLNYSYLDSNISTHQKQELTTSSLPQYKELEKGQGKGLSWPVKGKIITYFGQGGRDKNKGVDIQTAGEEVVRASLEGKVVFADFLRGYRKTIITEHPEGIYCVYANLSTVFVKRGDYIEKGRRLGKVGTDLRRGVHLLHFEVRKGYHPENPMLYLK
ncbi:MAG: hypothetical protein B6D56_03750 [Candidatus Omnitrophica bacterium 4484_70.1]|nr:MAG: hypothetical protein B6D56_03750 [Candidatus Omnitrophica bacterium 4484_70.1]